MDQKRIGVSLNRRVKIELAKTDTAEEKKTTIDYIKRSLENEINRTRQKLSEIERSLK